MSVSNTLRPVLSEAEYSQTDFLQRRDHHWSTWTRKNSEKNERKKRGSNVSLFKMDATYLFRTQTTMTFIKMSSIRTIV